MRAFFFLFLLPACLIILIKATEASAGNKWMMENNANELIMLNSKLLKHIGATQKDGKIVLSGDVVHEDGKVIIKLYQLQQVDPSGKDNVLAPETFDTEQPYQIFLREEALTEIPDPVDRRIE